MNGIHWAKGNAQRNLTLASGPESSLLQEPFYRPAIGLDYIILVGKQ